jgi:hypothetical protein
MPPERPTLDRPHYTRAPLLEALIDIQVRMLSESSTLALLETIRDEEGGYTETLPRFQNEVTFPTEGATPVASTRMTGYQFRNSERQYVMQVRQDGFSLSKLAPYERWEPFCAEAKRLWKRYVRATQPASVTRREPAIKGVMIGPGPNQSLNRIALNLYLEKWGYMRRHPEVSDLPHVESSNANIRHKSLSSLRDRNFG